MIRRPLNERFADKVLAGIKTTTIRDNPWPVGKPIMLFRWEGKPYRSKQVEIAPVIVEETCGIRIVVGRLQVAYLAERKIYNGKLWKSEGFNSIEDMDSWFVATIKPGTGVTKSLMRFKLYTPHATSHPPEASIVRAVWTINSNQPQPPTTNTVNTEAIKQLKNHQRQLDRDGIEVGVSRQALEEVLAELASAYASADTYREQYEASEQNIKNLMHYAKGQPGHVSISSPAIPIRDVLLWMHADKADIETKWEEICRAIGAHGPESDPLTGTDTNDMIHARAMERIRDMVSDEF